MPTLAKTNEVVAGYRLRKRLGAGGYGEVWSADAPGGLIKAIKFIYGYLDEDRAKRELKSLNRVRDVRHPFLLSLERIEVVEGQLVIVTELAESSLKERFIACRRQLGLVGVPRDELMVYVRDTAEALDFMREKHDLQHLDVKPENLLLVGGRVKVADFGLVKDIGERTFTMMGGLTPLYAPPEVFEGHPSRHSDQYSLAIVFQELLTGKVPFSGKSAARLGLQHAKAPPDLSSLPVEDRAAIERALSKDPNRRFGSCLELVKALEAGVAPPSQIDTESIRRAAGKTDTTPNVVRSPHMKRLLESRPVSNGKPFDMLTPSHHCRPTLFLGIGGTAGAVLDRLKQRTHRRFLGETVEAIRFLQTDVDQRALNHLVSLHGPGLDAQETLALPLRRPEYYRNRSHGYLKWISRRWLFNIPRSLTTDGLRPLARLAFVDNASRLFDRVREELRLLHDPDVLQRSEQAARAPFERTLRVVLVASISGATGGGMVLDAAYAVRQIAHEIGLDQCQICGVLTHATNGDINDRELGIVNAYATLKELLYYRQIGYPGDEDCGLNATSGDRAAFDDVYFATPPESSSDFTKLVEDVAEYLFLDTATEGGSFLDACRRAARRSLDESDECYVQLFGVHREEFLNEWDIEQHVRKLTHLLIQWWRGHDQAAQPEAAKGSLLNRHPTLPLISPARQAKLEQLAQHSFGPLGIESQAFWDRLRQIIKKELATSSEELYRGLISHARGGDIGAKEYWLQVTNELTRLFGPLDDDSPQDSPLYNELLDSSREQAELLANRIMLWLRKAFGLNSVRLAGAQTLGDKVTEKLQALEQECLEAAKGFMAQSRDQSAAATSLFQSLDRRRVQPGIEDLAPLVEKMWSLRYSAFEHGLAWRLARMIKDRLAMSLEALFELGLGLKGLAERATYDEQTQVSDFLSQFSNSPGMLKAVSDAIIAEQELEENELYPALQRLLQYPEKATEQLFRITRNALLEAVRQVELTPEAADNGMQQIRRCLTAAHPAIEDCGGRQRLLVMTPASSNRRAVAKAVQSETSMVPAVICAGLDFVACYELEKLSLPRIAAKLVDGRQDFIDCAERVHTRKDIDWDDAFVS